MDSYLITHPPASPQFRRPRRQPPSGVIVVHTAENTPDFVAFDGGAEAVANFIAHRPDPGSYHDLADSDSIINLVPYDAEAFQDGTGSNPHAYAISGATRADVWPLAPQAWRDNCVSNMARAARQYADWLWDKRGIVIPARRITRAESELRIPGFISHAERDPARRKDPGEWFPWNQFLTLYLGDPTPPAEDDEMAAFKIIYPPSTHPAAGTKWLQWGLFKAYIPSQELLNLYIKWGFGPEEETNAEHFDLLASTNLP